jgi:hypothetical protein
MSEEQEFNPQPDPPAAEEEEATEDVSPQPTPPVAEEESAEPPDEEGIVIEF